MLKAFQKVNTRTGKLLHQSRHFNVGVIGAGSVGVACASSLIHYPNIKNIYMCDKKADKCKGEVMDLEDEAFISGTRVSYKTLEELKDADCDVYVVTAGAKQDPSGESRGDLIDRNAEILKSIIEPLFPLSPKTIMLVVANPVDVLTSMTQKMTADYIPQNQVIGTGTYLDTQRLRVALSKRLGVSSVCVHAYVLGEHGDSQIVPRSITRIGGGKITNFGLSDDELTSIERETKRKAYEIIKLKKHTCHGIGQCVGAICDNILNDRKCVMPVSLFHPTYNAHLGWPAVLGRHGVEQLLPVELTKEEDTQLAASAVAIRKLCDRFKGSP